MIEVAVVGFGTIGKRVADAVALQPDMRLAGVAIRRPSPASVAGATNGTDFFYWKSPSDEPDGASRPDADELIGRADVVVDCGPRGTGRGRQKLYDHHGVAAVFCGGEDPAHVDATYSALVNHDACRGLRRLRVASCNLTAVARTIGAVERCGSVQTVHATFIRCASDPDKGRKGPVGEAIVSPNSKHGHDIERLFPHVNATSAALSVPMTSGHIASMVLGGTQCDSAEVRAALSAHPRVRVGMGSEIRTGALRQEFGTGRRQDCHDLVVLDESLKFSPMGLQVVAWIHMESITIPDTIDAVRAVGSPEVSAAKSIATTDETMAVL